MRKAETAKQSEHNGKVSRFELWRDVEVHEGRMRVTYCNTFRALAFPSSATWRIWPQCAPTFHPPRPKLMADAMQTPRSLYTPALHPIHHIK